VILAFLCKYADLDNNLLDNTKSSLQVKGTPMASMNPEDIKLNTKLPFTSFLSTAKINAIVSNKNFECGDWNDLCEIQQRFEGVYKRALPIDFRDFCMLVLSKVAPKTHVPKHSHKEGIFRYIIEGSLKLNDEDYRAGDWIVVPQGFPYEIFTVEGYTAIAGYLMACDGDGGDDGDDD
jgi:hypothetical protein